MSDHTKTLAALLSGAAGIALMANVASAMPASHALALKNAVPNAVENVRWGGGWRGGGWRGGWGWGWGGFAAGAIVGSALAAPYYYGYGPYYDYPYYPAPYPYPAAGYAPGGDAVAYCAQRYRSYDPRTGTFLGNDGVRHPCP